MKILITGTPGVGKTTFSKELSEKFGLKHIDISAFIKEKKIFLEHDKKFDTLIFDENKVSKYLLEELKTVDSFIIDTHSCEVAKDIEFDFIFLLTAPIEILYKRLKDRGYEAVKIEENIQSEIFGVVMEEVEDFFGTEYDVIGEEENNITIQEAIEKVDMALNLVKKE